ncbi:PIR Superfamily Protein [Plasmodium ovale wallikeri]|uniref:PIR Superfamily Protein n=1 Tax=Plasmodium ovale wallikeri TaxID=864142 RepID=A0A1A8YNM7_PLAOA|nr:PIR Superfamily Protein [Plasmodium ovale wallikeri]SBT58898.1 PIR Superfamily Protein [Plasmodium ovale wallikeri]
MILDSEDNKLLTKRTLEKNQDLKELYGKLNEEWNSDEITEEHGFPLDAEFSDISIKSFYQKWVRNFYNHFNGNGFISLNNDVIKNCKYLKYWFYDQIITNKLSNESIGKIFKEWTLSNNEIEFFIKSPHNEISNIYPDYSSGSEFDFRSYSGDGTDFDPGNSLGFHPGYGFDHYVGPDLGLYSDHRVGSTSEDDPVHDLSVVEDEYDSQDKDRLDNYGDIYTGVGRYTMNGGFMVPGYYYGGFVCPITISTLVRIMNEKLFMDYAEFRNSERDIINTDNVICKDPYKSHINKIINLCKNKNKHSKLDDLDDCDEYEEIFYCDLLDEAMSTYDIQSLSELQCNEEEKHPKSPNQQHLDMNFASETPLGPTLPSSDGDHSLQDLKDSPPSGNSNVHTSVTVPTSIVGILGIFFSLYKLTPLGPLLRKFVLKEDNIVNSLEQGADGELFGNSAESDNLNFSDISHYISYNPS